MITYQDFMKVPENRRIDYVRSIISQHKSSKEYKFAEVAEEYYKHRNVTIRRLVRLLYTVTGKQIPDTFSTDWRLRTDWFNFFTVQLNQYLLSNGVSWQNEDTKDKLGVKFDRNLKKLGRYALTHKVSFGFWNLDHLEPYSFLEFAPIYDEENGALTAGVRFWQIDSSKPLRAQLFEPDGYTDLMWTADGKGKETGEILHPKRPYIQVMRTSEADGTEIYDGYNYPTFPIVPFYGIEKQSELEGRQELIDCCDLILSGFANTIEDASYIYWAIQGANGMKDIDLAKFIQHMKTIHAALVKGDGATATPNAIEPTTRARPMSVSIASVTRSKHTTLSMTPPAKLSSRLTIRSEFFCKTAPIRPPSPVPPTPARAVVMIKVSIMPIVISLLCLHKLAIAIIAQLFGDCNLSFAYKMEFFIFQ